MRKYVYIGLGGFLGAILRVAIKSINISKFNELFPINTLLINISGCFLIALFMTVCIEVLEIDSEIRLGVATGFIGSFTTFSTICKEVIIMLGQGQYMIAAAYTLTSVFLGMSAVYLGIIIAREIIIKFVNRNKAASTEDELSDI